MDPRFTAYGETVCRSLRYATSREKQAVARELTHHLEDHAQALLDADFAREDALDMALAAMGDPEEVGRELDREYPLRWLVLARLALPLLVLGLVLALFVLPNVFTNVSNSLQARYAPDTLVGTTEGTSFPLDIRWELPGGSVIVLYRMTLSAALEEDYGIRVYAVKYNKNPLIPIEGAGFALGLSAGDSQAKMVSYDSFLGAHYAQVRRGETITAHYNKFGTTYETEIPIPWEEVP